ncbi:MAG: CoA transferase [Myxococcota bacterium]
MSTAGPLEGIRVANFGWVWAGPVLGQTLAFLGADVLKIESRARVDMTRTLPPFAEGIRDPDRSLSNHACWAGNGSVSLNLKKPEAIELAKELIVRCDVVAENFGPGVMEQFGLGYEDLKQVRSDVILFSMPAAGLTGPMRDVRTYGLSLTSTTGLDSLTGYEAGEPIPMENAFSDPLNGILGGFAILAALAYRDRSGEGQHIDYSQQEAVMQLVGPAFMDHSMNGRTAGPLGNRHPLGAAAPHGVFRCAGDDRWISIAVRDEAEWHGLCEAMENPGLSASPDYADHEARLANLDALHAEVSAFTADAEPRALSTKLQSFGVPAAPVSNVADLIEDPQYRARETFVEVNHPLGFTETIYGAYVKLGRSTVTVRPGPMIGQDNERVFRELLELSPERYAKLVEEEVIY